MDGTVIVGLFFKKSMLNKPVNGYKAEKIIIFR